MAVEHEVESPYARSTGPSTSRFLTALRDERVILGRHCEACDLVVVPPGDACDLCGGELGAFEPVGPEGTVTGLTIVHAPSPLPGIEPPFAYLRIRLDGACTDLVHIARDVERVARGARVHPVWAAESTGTIRDIDCFEPVSTNARAQREPGEPISIVRSHLRIPYRQEIGALEERFRDGLVAGLLHGNRCPACAALYVPPRASCPGCFVACDGFEPVSDRGVIDTFTVVDVPFYGQEIPTPYVLASIHLDGAAVALFHLVAGIDPASVRSGLRVRAVWRDAAARRGLLNDDIDRFEPEAP